jgi:hypothetical protein
LIFYKIDLINVFDLRDIIASFLAIPVLELVKQKIKAKY